MQPKCIRCLLAIVGIALVLGVLSSSVAKTDFDNHLNNYISLTKNQSAIRIYRFSDGYPKISRYVLTDQYGMQWYGIYGPMKLYAFTGTDFIDVLSTNTLTASDTIVTHYQMTDKTPILEGKKHIYKWNGYKLIAYRFPENDVIQNVMPTHDNRIFCYGKTGYAVLNNTKWVYYKYVNYQYDVTSELFGTHFSKGDAYLSITSDKKNNGLLKYTLLKNGRAVTTDFSETYQPFSQPPRYAISELDSINICIGKIDSNDLYFVNLKHKTINKVMHPASGRIINIANDNASWDVISLLIESNAWTTEVYSYQKHSSFPTLASRMEFPARIIGDTYKYATLWKGELHWYKGNYKKGGVELNVDWDTYGKTYLYTNLDKFEISKVVFSSQILRVIPQKNNDCVIVTRHPDYNDFYEFSVLGVSEDKELRVKFSEYINAGDDWYLLYANYDNDRISYVSRNGLEIIPQRSNVKDIIKQAQLIGLSVSELLSASEQKIIKIKDAYLLVSLVEKNDTESLVFSRLKGKVIEKVNSFTINKPRNIKVLGTHLALSTLKHNNGSNRVYFRSIDKWCYYDYDVNTFVATSLGTRYVEVSQGNFLRSVDTYEVVSLFPYQTLSEKLSWESMWQKLAVNDSIPNRAYESLNWVLSYKPVIDESNQLCYIGNNEYTYIEELQNWGISHYKPDVMQKASIKQNAAGTHKFNHPTISYNLVSGKVAMHPNWLSVLKNDQNQLFALDKTAPGEQGVVSIRRILNGVVQKKDDNPIVSNDELKNYNLFYASIDDGLVIQLGSRLLCYVSGKWLHYNLPKHLIESSLSNAIRTNNTIYVGYPSFIIKLTQDNGLSIFGNTQGIPEGSNYLYNVDGSILIRNGSNIYTFSEPQNFAKIVLPGYWANNTMVSAERLHVFKHRVNTIRFPIYILNTMNPEKCTIDYQLKGLNDAPVRIPYTKELRFDKLKPGIYTFSFTATTEVGHKLYSPSIEFRILPPFYLTWWAYLIYAVLAGLGVFSLIRWRTRQLKKRNQDLEQTVEERTAELKERQLRIQESIEYAALIQKSILPQQEEMIRLFRKHFVIWQPRDIVGGDFYWMHAVSSDTIFFAVIDCTGHGVPGALLSMTVNAVLDKLVRDIGMREPGQILSTMHSEIGKALHQDMEHTQQDGIEIALLRFDKAADEVCFSGAGLHLLHKSGGSLHHIRGSKYGLGGIKWHSHLNFSETTLSYSKSDLFYLYTDGIVDQPVENIDKPIRMGHTQWLEFISSISDKPFIEQQESCKNLIDDMLKVHKQRDDITIIGLAL